jgi:hypothetical protein
MKTDHEIASEQANNTNGSPTPTPAVAQLPQRDNMPKARKSKAVNRAKDTAKPIKGVKLPRQPKAVTPASDIDKQPTDRLPTTLKELQATKGGFVASLFLTGKDEPTIVKELKEAFNLTDAKSATITRRIIRRARLYKRIFEIIEQQR